MVLTDEYKYPFSLFAACRSAKEADGCSMQRVGGVSEFMDTAIGRSVTKIKGAVSANNHVDISGLALTGRVVYVQMSLIKPATATFHIDVLTASEESLRITFSTLYEQPRFISRTVRLPLPAVQGWMTLFFDVDRIIELFVPHSGRPGDNAMKCIKGFQICSNMCIRDIVTSNVPIALDRRGAVPKELAVIAPAASGMPWIDLSSGTPAKETFTLHASGDDAANASMVSGTSHHAATTAANADAASVSFAPTATPKPKKGHAADAKMSVPMTPAGAEGASTLDGQQRPVLSLVHVSGYNGSPSALLYNGTMAVVASGALLILIDLDSEGVQKKTPNFGFWRYFRSVDATVASPSGGYRQAFIKGSHSSIHILEVSPDGKYLLTGEVGSAGRLTLWDITEGRRVASFQPHASHLNAISVNSQSSQLVTVGTDASNRTQIIVWDIRQLILSCATPGEHNAAEIAAARENMIVAKQLSDFPINKISFSPFDSNCIISCGRENIRFWRIKKGHLPGRPVQLNEYSRGFVFTHMAFQSMDGTGNTTGKEYLFVASSKGMLMKIDCAKEQIICSYQLHSGAISALAAGDGILITGGEDSRLRIWPLDLTDFLMEAHHESTVSHVSLSEEGRFLCVGTASGTLGILNVFEHSYRTIVRSHTGSITSVATTPTVGDETMTVSADGTIRLWDTLSGMQKFEFNSPEDKPCCGAYHPTLHIIACGFASGAVRIFDVQTTSTLFERDMYPKSVHNTPGLKPSPVASLVFAGHQDEKGFSSKEEKLFAVSEDGRLTVFDVANRYTLIKTAMVCPYVPEKEDSNFTRKMFISLGSSDKVLTVCGSEGVSSLVILDTHDLMPLFRVDADRLLFTATKKASPVQKGSTIAKTGIAYPATSPYYKVSEEIKASQAEVEDTFRFDKANATRSSAGDKVASVPVIGMRYVSDWNGLGDYLMIMTQKQITVVSFGDSSLIGSALTTRRAARASHIPRLSSPMPESSDSVAAVNIGEPQTPGKPEGSLLPIIKTIFNNAWAQRTVRKIQNNEDAKVNAAIASFDPKNSLIYLAGTTNPASGGLKGPAPVTSVLRVIGVTMKRSKVMDDSDDKGAGESASPSRLSVNLSMPQLFNLPAGEVANSLTTICPSIYSGRVITSGPTGTVAVWRLSPEYILDAFRQTLAAATPSWTNRLGSLSETLRGGSTNPVLNGALMDDFDAEGDLDVDLGKSSSSYIKQPQPQSSILKSDAVPRTSKSLSDSLTANRGLLIDSRVNISMGGSENLAFMRHDIPRSPLQKKFSVDISSPKRPAFDTAESDLVSGVDTPKQHKTLIPTPTRKRREEAPPAPQVQSMPVALAAPAAPFSPPRSLVPAVSIPQGKSIKASSGPSTPKPVVKPTFYLQESSPGDRRAAPILLQDFDDAFEESVVPTRPVLASPGIAVMKMDELVQATDEAMESVPDDKNCYDEFDMGKWSGKRGIVSHEIASSSVFDGTNRALDFTDFKREPSDILFTPADTAHLEMTILTQRFAVPPVLSLEQRLLASSDSKNIFVQSFNGKQGVTLSKPQSAASSQLQRGVVKKMSFSPSGELLAAVIDYYSTSSPEVEIGGELLVWCKASNSTLSDANQLSWTCLGNVHLQTGSENRHLSGSSSIGWTHDDSLILAVPVDTSNIQPENGAPKTNYSALVSVTNWIQTPNRDGAGASFPARTKGPGGIEMPGRLTPLPGFTESPHGISVTSWNDSKVLGDNTAPSRSIKVLFWAGKRMCIAQVTCPTAEKSKFRQVPSVSILWTDDTGNQGPIHGISMGWVPQTVYGFFAAERIAISGRGIKSAADESRSSRPAFMGVTDENMDRYKTLGLSAPVFSVLTASGIVRMIRLRAYTSPQSCVVKIPAAHTSGNPKNLFMSPSGNELILSYSSSIRVYSVSHSMKEEDVYSASAAFVYKVSLSFLPMHCQFVARAPMCNEISISKRVAAKVGFHDILVSSTEGDMGLACHPSESTSSRGGSAQGSSATAQPAGTFHRIASAPPVSAAPDTTARPVIASCVVPEAKVLATVTKGGSLVLTHSETGVTLPYPDAFGLNNCLSLAARGKYLAIGTSCGHVCVYIARSMQLVKVLYMPQQTADLRSDINIVLSARARSSRASKDSKKYRVVSLLFVGSDDVLDTPSFVHDAKAKEIVGYNCGTHIVALLGDASVCVASLPEVDRSVDPSIVNASQSDFTKLTGGKQRISSDHIGSNSKGNDLMESVDKESGTIESPAQHTYLRKCYGAKGVFAVVRNDMLDIFSIAPAPNNQMVAVPVLARVARCRVVDFHCKDVKKSNPRMPSTLHVYDLSVQFVETSVVVTAVCSSLKSMLQTTVSPDLWLSVGVFDVQERIAQMINPSAADPYQSTNKLYVINMTRRVNLGLDFHQLIHRGSANAKYLFCPHYRYLHANACVCFTATGIVFINLSKVYDLTPLDTVPRLRAPRMYPELIDLKQVTFGCIEHYNLSGADSPSGVPGANNRQLEELALVACAPIATPSERDSDVLEQQQDSLSLALMPQYQFFVSRSHPSPSVFKVVL